MQKHFLLKIFKLEGYVIEKMEEKGGVIFIYCHSRKRGMWFQDEYSTKVPETRNRVLPHVMMEDQVVSLVVTQRRFNFSKHKTKRWEKLPDVGRRKQTTNTFRINTLRELQRDNYSGTGFKRQKSHMYPSHILDGMDFKVEWKDEIRRIGMDGKGVGHNKVVHNIVNLDKNKPLIVLPDLNQKQIKKN
jgi:hypothetical protein